MNEPDKRNEPKKLRAEKFVADVFARCKKDKGLAARLKRANNPDMEYQCWEFLANWNINLEEHSRERLPFATVASAIASADATQNGTLELGEAIARCYEDGRESDAAKTKLRRLLACADVNETCRVLRPLLSLIGSRVAGQMNYASLLEQLLDYHFVNGRERVRARWAQKFYSSASSDDQETGQ